MCYYLFSQINLRFTSWWNISLLKIFKILGNPKDKIRDQDKSVNYFINCEICLKEKNQTTRNGKTTAEEHFNHFR